MKHMKNKFYFKIEIQFYFTEYSKLMPKFICHTKSNYNEFVSTSKNFRCHSSDNIEENKQATLYSNLYLHPW